MVIAIRRTHSLRTWEITHCHTAYLAYGGLLSLALQGGQSIKQDYCNGIRY